MAGTPETSYVQQDFSLIPWLNAVAQPVAGSVAPSAANIGQLYRNTASKRLEYVWDATTVVSIPYSGSISNADIAAGAAIALSKLATDPLARTNHTGTQLAATISDFAAAVQAFRLDQLAAPTADVNLNSRKITALADAVANTDATTLQQVNNLISAVVNNHDWKDGVRVASSVNVTVASPGANVDGVALAAGDRVLLYGQTAGAENGIYVWNGAATPMTRATDADAATEVTGGMSVPIEAGTHTGIGILTTQGAVVIGTTALTFTILSAPTAYVQGTGITISGNTISLTAPVTVALGGTGGTDAPTARANLNVPMRGFTGLIGALVAGTGLDVVHNLGTTSVIVQVVRVSDSAIIPGIGLVIKDANTVTVTADVAVGANALRLNVSPLV